MKRFLCGFVVWGLFVSVTASAKSQQYIYTTLDAPGFGTTAWGINNIAQIVGENRPGDGIQGFLLSGGSYTTFEGPGATQTIC